MTRAEHIVAKLLEDHSYGDYEQRAGGPGDPHRQVTMNIDTHKLDYSGQRPMPAGEDNSDLEDYFYNEIDLDDTLTDEEKLELKNYIISQANTSKNVPLPEISNKLTPEERERLFSQINKSRKEHGAQHSHPRFNLKFGDSTGGA